MNEPTVSKENQTKFLNDLRQKTAVSHQQLEDNVYSKAILEPNVTLEDYQTYIAKLYGVIASCEQDVFSAISQILPDTDFRQKKSLIIDDLKITGFDNNALENLPVHHFEFSGIPQAMGIMYVLEGSTLGGKVLYKHIHKTLGLDASTGASYFWGYGEDTGILWKSFISTLAQYAVSENCEDEIISSAVQTFTAIDHWLNRAEINK